MPCLETADLLTENSNFKPKAKHVIWTLTLTNVVKGQITILRFWKPRPLHTVSEDEYDTPSNKHYWNGVNLTEQNQTKQCCYPLEILTKFEKGLDLLMLKIWGL